MARLLLSCLQGLTVLHSLGLIHFDIKPDNLLYKLECTEVRRGPYLELDDVEPKVKVGDAGLFKLKLQTFATGEQAARCQQLVVIEALHVEAATATHNSYVGIQWFDALHLKCMCVKEVPLKVCTPLFPCPM